MLYCLNITERTGNKLDLIKRYGYTYKVCGENPYVWPYLSAPRLSDQNYLAISLGFLLHYMGHSELSQTHVSFKGQDL